MRDVLRLIALLCALFSAPLALSAPAHAEPEREAQELLEEFASERALSLS